MLQIFSFIYCVQNMWLAHIFYFLNVLKFSFVSWYKVYFVNVPETWKKFLLCWWVLTWLIKLFSLSIIIFTLFMWLQRFKSKQLRKSHKHYKIYLVYTCISILNILYTFKRYLDCLINRGKNFNNCSWICFKKFIYSK